MGHLVALSLCLPTSAQPLCEVLLNPAFSFNTYGLQVLVEDSSTTFGIQSTAEWSFGDGSSITTVDQHGFQAPGTYQVCLTLTATELPCSATYCREVTVPATDCGGSIDSYFDWSASNTNSVSFLDMSFTNNTGPTLWEFGDGSSSTDPEPDHTWSIPGPHFVTLTRGADTCLATYGRWVEVDGNVTTCGPGLFVDFYTEFDGNEFTFTPSIVANGTLPLASVWSYGDGVIDTTAIGQHIYQEEGPHQTCLLIGALNVGSLDSCFALVCHTSNVFPATGINERGRDVVEVWPNPFGSSFQFRSEGVFGRTEVQLKDLLGRTVAEQVISGNGTFKMDASELRDGAYVLMVSGKNHLRSALLVKGLE